MQIHELNNYRGNLGSEAYIAVDNGMDTGKITVSDLTGDIQSEVSELDTYLNSRIDNIIAGGDAPSVAEVTDARLGANGNTYASLGDAVRGQFEIVNNKVDNAVASYSDISAYLYRTNMYMRNGTPTALSGYNIYRIPLSNLDAIGLAWDDADPFYSGLSDPYVAGILKTDDSYTIIQSDQANIGYYVNFQGGYGLILADSTMRYLFINAKADKANNLILSINREGPTINNNLKVAKVLSDQNSGGFIEVACFLQASTNRLLPLISPYYSHVIRCKKGDRFVFNSLVSGVSFRGSLLNNDGTALEIATTENSITLEKDATALLFGTPNQSYSIEYYPIDSIQIGVDDVLGLDGLSANQFSGYDGVAFGTSLTYRSQTTYGYLTKLSELSGVTFDNQGIGSSYILGNMLTAIKNYADYADKRVCLLEGFVNDWFVDKPLGTWKDNDETTVCGCVRSAINYIMSQNDDLTLFLILDHYGRNYSGSDCSTTATNNSGLTQYEYYSEIAKVAESLGIPVIKEFEDSGISENTPQYLADNIHCNALGAIQSAFAIWYQMKQYPLSQV